MVKVPIFVKLPTPRLLYTLNWLFQERLGIDYQILTNRTEALAQQFCIGYGESLGNGISIPDTGLLRQTNISEIALGNGTWENLPVLFHQNDSKWSVPFDLFSAIFYCISRYEEYLPFEPDKHERYPATNSILYQLGLLDRPIVDEWITAFKASIVKAHPLTLKTNEFSFRASYDIDIAWSYLHKGIARTTGALVRALLKGNTQEISDRLLVLRGKRADPYDSFESLFEWHQQYGIRPYYFILAALSTTAFDKNIHPNQPAMESIIRQLAADGIVGIHPSYYPGKDGQTHRDEKQALERIIGSPINCSRQHYIRMILPETYRRLLQMGITDDFSMGYGTHLGFRAGTGNSFLWYDLLREQTTDLRVHPFCFMDTTARYEQGLSAEAAFAQLYTMTQRLKQCDSVLTIIFHNFSLGTDQAWTNWREAYGSFLKKLHQEVIL